MSTANLNTRLHRVFLKQNLLLQKSNDVSTQAGTQQETIFPPLVVLRV